MFASYYTLNQAMGTKHNWKLTHWLPQEMADNTQEINITSKPFGNFIYCNLSSFPWMIFKWWALNWMGPTQHLFKWNRLEMDGEKRGGYSSADRIQKWMERLQWTRYRDRLGLTEKGKEKHQSTLKKQGTLNIVIYCVYHCMGCGLNFFWRNTALNLNPLYNNRLS